MEQKLENSIIEMSGTMKSMKKNLQNPTTKGLILKLTPGIRNLVALSIASIITVIVYSFGHDVILNRAQTQFVKDSQAIERSLNNNVKIYRNVLYGIHSFIETNPDLNYSDFNKYIEGLDMKTKYPAVQMVRFITPVEHEKVNEFYNTLSHDYNTTIKDPQLLKEADEVLSRNREDIANNPTNFIIKYSTPLTTQVASVGQDLSYDSKITATLVESMHSQNIVSSGKMFKGKNEQGQDTNYVGFSIGNFSTEHVNSEYVSNYIGTATIGIKLDKALFSDINNANRYIDFQIIDNGAAENYQSSLIYDSRYQRPSINELWPNWLNTTDSEFLFSKHYEVQIGKRNFELYTFTQNLPPNIIELNVIYLIALVVFLLSFVLSQRWLTLENAKEEAKNIAKKMTQELRDFAETDSLTGLPNRRAFMQDLHRCVDDYTEEHLYLMFIDLDGFKRVNDTLGHQAGDKVLRDFAARLLAYSQTNPLPIRFYRIGGDEFTIILEPRLSKKPMYRPEVEQIASDILALTQARFKVDEEEFTLSESIGIAEYPKSGKTPEELFKHSDLAMYEAKHSGKNQFLFYSREMTAAIERKSQMENLLLSAIEKKEFHIVFQPKLKRMGSGFCPVGAEVLIRWHSEKLGDVAPMIFIPIAEEANLMTKIGRWVVEETAEHLERWKNMGFDDIKLSINASAKEFNNEKFVEQYTTILKNHSLTPTNLTIEITETTMMKQPEKTRATLQNFREKGFKISVDDFGTGYSSLSYLRRFPVNEIKIDKSFTNDILTDSQDRIVMEGIIDMSQKLGLQVVVEGVETKEQVEWLDRLGPVQMQGYYFSQPLKEQEFLEFWKSCILDN